MSNIVQFRQPEFVNIHGRPMDLTARQVVLIEFPDATLHHRVGKLHDKPIDFYEIEVTFKQRGKPPERAIIGSGGTEESAWRCACQALSGDDEA